MVEMLIQNKSKFSPDIGLKLPFIYITRYMLLNLIKNLKS